MAFPGDSSQQGNATILIQEGTQVGAGAKAKYACVMLGWGENNMRADGCNSSNHCGLFQLSSALQAQHDYHDLHYWARQAYLNGFWGRGGLKQLALDYPNQTAGYIVNLCQGAYGDLAAGAAYYDRYRSITDQTMAALGYNAGGGGGPGVGPSIGGGMTVGKLLTAYNPSTEIRHDFYQLGTYGHNASQHALAMRNFVQRVKFCTTKGPAY